MRFLCGFLCTCDPCACPQIHAFHSKLSERFEAHHDRLKNVLSFGDSVHERHAVHEVRAWALLVRCVVRGQQKIPICGICESQLVWPPPLSLAARPTPSHPVPPIPPAPPHDVRSAPSASDAELSAGGCVCPPSGGVGVDKQNSLVWVEVFLPV